jgi:adenine-specific DNA-methyltransferase
MTELITMDKVKMLHEYFPEMFDENGKIIPEIYNRIVKPKITDDKGNYDFNWMGKDEAIAEANRPTTATLRPCKEESKDWDTTENLYIEGDNLEVLKLLQKSYAGKIKMIYIDPPYNTGKDFVYKDNFKTNIKNNQNLKEDIIYKA